MKCFLSLCALFVCLCGCKTSPVEVTESQRILQRDPLYLVVDLSGGANATFYPVSTLSAVPEGGWTNEYKTTKLVLRRIEAGIFIMGSHRDEFGSSANESNHWRRHNEDLHQVTLTKPYYMGIFEVTQKQWSLVIGHELSRYKGDARPVERVSYDDIRGAEKWFSFAKIDDISFMGKLRAKTSLDFDLPTEAQWEYACRAGTTTALNSGKDLVRIDACPNMNKVGRYGHNNTFPGQEGSSVEGRIVDGKGGYDSNHTTVGSYLPNAWGLYDMHGNVGEWCLDWRMSSLGTLAETDPIGDTSGSFRIIRGGSWRNDAWDCRSAYRWNYNDPSSSDDSVGLRIAVPLGR